MLGDCSVYLEAEIRNGKKNDYKTYIEKGDYKIQGSPESGYDFCRIVLLEVGIDGAQPYRQTYKTNACHGSQTAGYVHKRSPRLEDNIGCHHQKLAYQENSCKVYDKFLDYKTPEGYWRETKNPEPVAFEAYQREEKSHGKTGQDKCGS